MEFKDLTIVTALRGLEQKEFSREELVSESQKRIDELEPSLKAFLAVERIDPTAEGVLSGIPCAIKDVIVTKGVKSTGGSRILENYIPTFDATSVARLKQQGAVIMGKTNCDEFAMGSSTEHSAFYPTRNPHDPSRVPGGTSGGSAAAVASGEVLFALGSDTGGSVRQPASHCGCVGFKPTYGRVSRYGLMAAASSLDHIGILSKTCEDASIVLKVIEGKDHLDATSKEFQVESRKSKVESLEKPLSGIKFGIIDEYMKSEGLDGDVKKAIQGVIETVEALGGSLINVSMPALPYALPCYYIINPCEISSNFSRYDGIRYGRKEPGEDLIATYIHSRTSGLGDEAKRRIMIGNFALSAGYYDQYYKQALKMRSLIRREYVETFERVDVLITPVAPDVAFQLGEKTNDPLKMYLEDIFTISLNLAGVPGVSIPCGWKQIEDKKLPIGAQLIAGWGRDYEMLEVGNALETVLQFRASTKS